MKIIPVKHVEYDKLERFLDRNATLDKNLLFLNGYVVEIDGRIEGTFLLDELKPGVLWLKQLYITPKNAAKLPVLLETILQLAKHQEAKSVYVHSHQPVVDILLEALQFHPEINSDFIAEKPLPNGNWWSYQVS